MGCNRHLLKQRRAFGSIGLSAKPFPNREFERENKNIILCWKDFTNYIYRVKKESINDNYNGLQGIGPKVRRSRSVYLQNPSKS